MNLIDKKKWYSILQSSKKIKFLGRLWYKEDFYINDQKNIGLEDGIYLSCYSQSFSHNFRKHNSVKPNSMYKIRTIYNKTRCYKMWQNTA